jgi:putative transposase
VVQRGNDRQACFRKPEDFEIYLQILADAATRFDVDIRAYVLMTNHVHLLVTPRADGAASKMMQQIGRRYVSYFNRKYRRSGGLWDGRFHSSLIESDRYLLACQRYIELNPIRAGMVSKPSEYRWSSYQTNALGDPGSLIRPHSVWMTLGRCTKERHLNYRRLFSESVDVERFRTASLKGLPVGPAAWQLNLERDLGVRFGSGKRGRPCEKGV